MARLFDRNRLFRLIRFVQQPWFHHVVFWALVFLMLLMAGSDSGTTLREVIRKLINLVFYMLVVYINLGYLIPKFLNQKNFLTYALLLVAMVALFTPIEVLLLYVTYEDVEPREFLIMNQHFIFLFQFMIAGGSTVIKIFSDWQRHQRDRKDLETQRMQSEIKFLKSQINPHFLFNTLNSLYALTLKKDDKAPEIVIKLSEMMRYMLYECNERRVPLTKEVNYIENYLAMEKLRQAGDADISFTVEGVVADQQIAPLLFIPFLENSFKHGLNHQIGEGYVHATLRVLGNKLLFRIRNSKPAQAPAPADATSGGIGLVNVQRRLNLLYPGQYKLDIEETDRDHIVELSLDLSA